MKLANALTENEMLPKRDTKFTINFNWKVKVVIALLFYNFIHII